VRALRLTLWPLAVAIGVGAEWYAYGWGDLRDAVPDVTTGWVLIACGLLCWSRRSASRSGVLMTAAGFAWFAGNFSAHALYLHRAPLVALVLTYPRGRASRRLEAAAAVLAAAAIVPAVARSTVATAILAACLLVLASASYVRARGRERPARLAALCATGFLAVLFTGVAVARVASETNRGLEATLLVYEAGLCVLAIGLLAGLLYEPRERATVGELLAELSETRSVPLRDALARALGDASLEVGHWLPELSAYVDPVGRKLELPPPGSARSITRIERDGHAVAVLVHDPMVLDDPGLEDAIATVTRLTAANARLQAEVQGRLAELEASRLRLLRSEDAERRRLEERLRDGAERRLLGLQRSLDSARARVLAESGTAPRIGRAEAQLAQTIEDLRELAGGLHPRALIDDGLVGALTSLADRSPVPVELSVSTERLPEEVEVATYFVCSEALANVAKHASASRASVRVSTDAGRVDIAVVDDGVGGADPTGGSGLRGLRDRVESLGGRLGVESPAGHGTRVTAELPLGHLAHRRSQPAPRGA
jgi:signal transduction histidine kinase